MGPNPLEGLKVAFIARHVVPRRGGDVPLAYCRALRQLGAEVEVILLGTGDVGADQLRAEGFRTHEVNLPKHSWRRTTSRAVAAVLASIAPDIVHARCYDAAIHASRAVAAGLPARLIITHPDPVERLDRRLRAWPYRHLPVRVISGSPSCSRAHQRWYWYPPERCVVLANPVCEEFFTPPPRDETLAAELGIADAYPVVIWTARLIARKGHADLLRAWREAVAEYPNGRLLIVGDGKLQAKLHSLAERLGVAESVVFTGFRPDVVRLLALSDILACPSHLDTLCMSVFEAMAAGVPVVSTRVWGPVDHIQDGVNGILVPIGAWQELAAAIKRVAGDRELARHLSEAGRAYAQRNFSFEAFKTGLAHIYLAAMAEV